jgi:hypothetical protein
MSVYNTQATTMATSASVQEKAFNNGNLKVQLQIARSTEDPEVQKSIAKSDNPRILMALASNLNLHPSIEEVLAESKYPGVISSLIGRRV